VKKLIPTTLTHLEINAFLYLDLLVYQALLCLSVYVIMDPFFFNSLTNSQAYYHFTDNEFKIFIMKIHFMHSGFTF